MTRIELYQIRIAPCPSHAGWALLDRSGRLLSLLQPWFRSATDTPAAKTYLEDHSACFSYSRHTHRHLLISDSTTTPERSSGQVSTSPLASRPSGLPEPFPGPDSALCGCSVGASNGDSHPTHTRKAGSGRERPGEGHAGWSRRPQWHLGCKQGSAMLRVAMAMACAGVWATGLVEILFFQTLRQIAILY